MKKIENIVIIDFGSTSLRLGVFNENLNNLYTKSQEIYKKDHLEEYSSNLNLLIRDAEKKISSHLQNIIVLYDTSEIFSVYLSIKKNFDQKTQVNDFVTSILSEANQLIKNNYVDKKIIHVITSKYIFDGKEYSSNFDKNIKAKTIIIEIKFLCLPIKIYDKIVDIFKKNNLEIMNFFCSSYVKTCSYIDSFQGDKFVSFLDIGWKRSTLISFNDKKLNYIKSVPIGGNHITKDISSVMEIDLNESEKIKRAFNKSEIEFSYDKNINKKNNNLIKEIIGKNISMDLLKKVVLARIEEIIDLTSRDIHFFSDLDNTLNSILVLTGNGSKLFNSNSFYLNDKYKFDEISFYEENDLEICKAGLDFEINWKDNEIKIAKKIYKKQGIFEKFFNLFSN